MLSTYQQFSIPQSLNKRASGILMPIFSLPSSYGIGTMGKAAYDFVDFLERSSQTYWQILPLGHTGYGNSPYQCFSVVAGNPYFIDLDNLVEMNLLTSDNLVGLEPKDPSKVDYALQEAKKLDILRIAFKHSLALEDEIQDFFKRNTDWVSDYALFMALKNHFSQKPVWEWDDPSIIKREENALLYYQALLSEDIAFYIFIQYLFFKQWNALRSYANKKGILIIGDIPMYPSADSCDVWCHPTIFKVDQNLQPIWIAGVPPDDFSDDGQVWGNPVYDWDALKRSGYAWWFWRICHTQEIVDIIRIDHFRAFQDFFQIPAGDTTAKNGVWIPGPRMDFFDAMWIHLGELPFILEDLGIIDDSVRNLRDQTGCPGMKVMIFGFNPNEDNEHMPHNWERNCVGYTSTHDSATIAETFANLAMSENELAYTDGIEYINYWQSLEQFGGTISICAIRTAMASHANTVIVSMSDLLSLGEEGHINYPGTIGDPNWTFRIAPDALTEELSDLLNLLTVIYRRA